MAINSSVIVIIPALNEERSIGKVLSAIPDWVMQVIVADNGSTDVTAEIARKYGADVIVEPDRGYGAACLAGMRCIKHCDIVVFIDADFSDHPNEMPDLVAPIEQENIDLVIGSRALGNAEEGSMTFAQKFGNRLACALISTFWGHSYSDLGPFRAIRYSALKRVGMENRSFGWTVEMQIKALQYNLSVKDVPVSYRNRIGKSKISGTVIGTIKAGIGILGMVFYLLIKGKQHGAK